ncbi:Olfactory Receptor 13A1 [Manis pentadactyla]|nr:Olfactory Receptor 13A1 [Manis pentadactyla]
MALVGNTMIISVVSCSTSLHSPMYFFLCNLATMDIVCTSCVLPKALVGLVSEENTISFLGCMAQLFFLVWSASSELLLLTVMAYDRCVAICHPLHYSSRMSPWLCRALAMAVWVVCAVNALVNTGLMMRLPFCGPNIITHFFCEIPPLLLLSCSSTRVNSIMTVLADVFYGNVLLCQQPSCTRSFTRLDSYSQGLPSGELLLVMVSLSTFPPSTKLRQTRVVSTPVREEESLPQIWEHARITRSLQRTL